jgi:DegT/DnrJ/EryC1/StrS aminotransferase family
VIPIALLLLADEEADAASAAVESGWVSQGAQAAAFERDFAALVGAPYACAAPAQGHHPVRLKHRHEAGRTYGSLKDVPGLAAL